MKLRGKIFALGILAAAVAGCHENTVNSVERAQPYGHATPVQDRRIITDPDLKGMADVLGVHESLVGDLTKVQVDVYNSYDSEQRFNYKFEWYDDSGMLFDSPVSIWKPVIIQGREQISLVGISPNPHAKDFRLKLQESSRN